MQKGTVLNLRQFNTLLIYLKNNWCLLTLTFMFLFGLAFGVFLPKSNELFSSISKSLCESFLKTHLTKDFFEIFSSALAVSGVFVALIFIFGTSVTGVTLVPIILSVRGALFGSLVGSIYAEYSFKGVAFNALIIIPPTIISVIFLIIASKESLKLSLRIINITLPQTQPKNLSENFKIYCKRYMLLLIPILISALLEAWVSVKFISIFNL